MQDRSYPKIHQPLYLGLQAGKNYGWGVCSEYLINELAKLTPVQVLNANCTPKNNAVLPGTLFQALRNVNFTPLFANVRGQRNYGYTFFENELTNNSLENSKRHDLVLAGSSWCRERMLEKGITNCEVLIQGVDSQKFYPIRDRIAAQNFIIFSGGKFELRKGQDLVLRAFKILQHKYDDMLLVNCWYNLWPHTIQPMASSPHIKLPGTMPGPWKKFMQAVYEINGLKADRIETYELLPNYMLRGVFGCTDVGVFPNRCEGGTNLVMMEYMACAKPIIAANTSGHRDIATNDNALLLNRLRNLDLYDRNKKLIGRWQEPSLDELVDKIEYAYNHREEIRKIGQKAGEDLKRFTWERTAKRLLGILGIPEAHGS